MRRIRRPRRRPVVPVEGVPRALQPSDPDDEATLLRLFRAAHPEGRAIILKLTAALGAPLTRTRTQG